MSNDNRGDKPVCFDPVDRRGTGSVTLVVVGIVFLVLALLMLTRGGLPGPEREGPRADTSPKLEKVQLRLAPPAQQ